MQFVQLDPREQETFEKYCSARGMQPQTAYDAFRHSHIDAPQRSFIFGFEDEGKLVASVSYIGHQVCRTGTVGTVFQACKVFTDPAYRGQGLFPTIAQNAEKALLEQDAVAIVGFPNKKAAPLWTEKLGYSICDTRPVLRVSSIQPFRFFDAQLLQKHLASPNRVLFNARETGDWKKTAHDDIVEDDYLTNYVFGRVLLRRKLGVNFRVLVVGGVEINKPFVFETFLCRLMKKYRCHICRISVNDRGVLHTAAKLSRGSGLTEPFIAKGLKWDLNASDFETTGGLKDVF